MDDQDVKRAQLDFCLQRSMDFVDKQGLEEAKDGKGVGDGTEGEEETPDEWRVDVRYATRLLRKANEMRARKRLCDVTIGLQDGKLEVHKSMLAAGSPFFKQLTETTRANTLNFFHVPCCVADILLDFMYTGEVSQEKVARLSRSERRLLREKAELFQIADQLEGLWIQLGVTETGKQAKPKAAAAPVPPSAAKKSDESPLEDQETTPPPPPPMAQYSGDSTEIVKRKVLYMNEKRKQGEFADWKIRISAVDIPVSKVFLAASCTYFADFFVRNPMDAKSETYTLTELNRRTFRKVLNFIYTGHFVPEGKELGELKDLLVQATYLGIEELSSKLIAEVESRLTGDNCFSIFSYANTIDCRQLFKSLSRYIGQLGSESAKNPGFLSLEFNDLKAALLNSELRFDRGPCLLYPTEFERCVFDLLLAWIRVDHVKRSSHVTELFDLVNRLGSPPYTGRKDSMHSRMPKELNHVMSTYYSKLIQEPKTLAQQQQQQQQQQTLTSDVKQAVKARRNLLPTRLLVSREYPLAQPQREDAALMPTELGPGTEGLTRCWHLPPTEWKLLSVKIFAADEALTRLTGCVLTYQRYPLFTDDTEQRAVHCGYRGAFDCCLELLATERIAQLGIRRESSMRVDTVSGSSGGGGGGGGGRGGGGGGGVGSSRAFIAWARTCIGRRLDVLATPTETLAEALAETTERPTEVISSPAGSRGFLHGFDLRFEGASGANGGALTVVWAAEEDALGLGEGPWASVIESE